MDSTQCYPLIAGKFCGFAMTNSTWTQNHTKTLWGGEPVVVFPPCDTDAFNRVFQQKQKALSSNKWIASIGQFRPEKNHELQIRSFARFLANSTGQRTNYKLLLIGGCRGADDEARVAKLRFLTKQLGVDENVEFHVNAPFNLLLLLMEKCSVNLHTMLEEHFGIGIVEGMAAGLITVAHASGGPLTDIIGPERATIGRPVGAGFLCITEEEYADTLAFILERAPAAKLHRIAANANARVMRLFSNDCFCTMWLKQLSLFINK